MCRGPSWLSDYVTVVSDSYKPRAPLNNEGIAILFRPSLSSYSRFRTHYSLDPIRIDLFDLSSLPSPTKSAVKSSYLPWRLRWRHFALPGQTTMPTGTP